MVIPTENNFTIKETIRPCNKVPSVLYDSSDYNMKFETKSEFVKFLFNNRLLRYNMYFEDISLENHSKKFNTTYNLEGSRFSKCNLTNVDLSGSGLNRVYFRWCILYNLNFKQCSVFGSQFVSCEFKNCNFSCLRDFNQVAFLNCKFTDCTFDWLTSAGKITIENCEFKNTIFEKTNFRFFEVKKNKGLKMKFYKTGLKYDFIYYNEKLQLAGDNKDLSEWEEEFEYYGGFYLGYENKKDYKEAFDKIKLKILDENDKMKSIQHVMINIDKL